MNFPPSTTLEQAKNWLRARVDKGDNCPLCGQHAKIYKRKINSGMARSLIHIYRISPNGWVHVRAIGAVSREEGKLAHWGLLEEQTGVGMHGGRAGYWRLTDKGRAFITGNLMVPKYAKIYNGKLLGLEGPMVTIKDALGDKFDYNQLMLL